MKCTTCSDGVVFAEEVSAGATRCRRCRAAHPAPPAPPPPPAPPALSRVVRALEQGFESIRERNPELPHVVVVVATGSEGRRGVTHWGHFHARRWVTRDEADVSLGLAEIKISAEGLQRPPVEVFTTMLHESVHALADVRGVRDTSNEGRYHNKLFVMLAREVGLVAPAQPDRKLGYSACTLDEQRVGDAYAPTVKRLTAALDLYRRTDEVAPARPTAPAKRIALECGCGRKLHIAPGVLAEGDVLCGRCDGVFQPAQ